MPEIVCSVDECDRLSSSRGWCNTHYERWRRTGTVDLRPKQSNFWARFWAKVDARGVCWQWTATTSNGYGKLHLPNYGPTRSAHRVAWELLVGPIPDGLELDHLCRNRGCVNPDHLEPVTPEENRRRVPWLGADFQRAKTHCPQGHAYAGGNLYTRPNGSRECRVCRAAKRAVAA